MTKEIKAVLITGATSGIGRAVAQLLAESHYKLIICGRRKEVLSEFKKELSLKTEVISLNFDVRYRSEVEKAFSSLPKMWKNIDILINNAGNAHGLAPIDKGDIDDWDSMIDGNVKGLLYVSKMIIPGMVKRKSGHIINIGSIAGKEVYPQGNIYCASKYAVDAITQGMRVDLFKHNIKVSAINPGLVNTEFSTVRFKGNKERADAVYDGMKALTAKDIAETIEFVISRPNHVNIADLLVLPTDQGSAVNINRKNI